MYEETARAIIEERHRRVRRIVDLMEGEYPVDATIRSTGVGSRGRWLRRGQRIG